MKNIFPIFLPNKGVKLDAPEEFLLPVFSPRSRNMMYWDDRITGRGGLDKFDTAALSGRVLKIDQFWLNNGTWYLMFCTPKDIYAYDFGNSRYDILTPSYNTGTITISAGSLDTVTGSGTSWDANLKAGDFIKIGSGSKHTGSTWYEIESVDNDTQLTLTSNAAECSASAYETRQTFSGGNTDYWDTEPFLDKNLNETWLATNGVNTPIKWHGTGAVTQVTGLPDSMKAKYVSVFKNRVIWAWTVEGGSNQPQRERWSGVANCVSYESDDFHDFVDEDTWITGMIVHSRYHVVMKEQEAYIGRHVGGSYVFDYDKSNYFAGCKAPFSILSKNGFVYYYGDDNRFHRCNLLQDESISDELFPDTNDFDPNLEPYIYGGVISSMNQLRWFCPHQSASYNDYVYVFDYKEHISQTWEYESEQACCCIGEFLNAEDLYVDDATWGEYYVDEIAGYWDARRLLDNAPRPIYGGYDGYVRYADQGSDDDGTAFSRTFRTSRINYALPQKKKRLQKQQYWFEAEATGSATIRIKLDDAVDWELETKSVSLIESTRDVVKLPVVWNKRAQNFQFEIDAPNNFSLLGFLNKVYEKRRTF